MNYPVAMCDRKVRQLYGGLTGIPTTLLIGRDGRVYSKVVGAPADLGEFDQRIQALLDLPASGETARVEQVSNAPALPAGAPSDPKGSSAQSSAPASAASVSDSGPVAIRATTDSSDSPPAIAPHAVSASAAKSPSAPDLSDPSPEQVQQIIREFTTKEKLFKLARDAYAY